MPGFSPAENRPNYARRLSKWDGRWLRLALALRWHDEARQITLRSLKPVSLPTAFAYASGALRIDLESCVACLLFQLAGKPGSRGSEGCSAGPNGGTENPFCHAPAHSRMSCSGRSRQARSDFHLCPSTWNYLGATRQPVFAAVSVLICIVREICN